MRASRPLSSSAGLDRVRALLVGSAAFDRHGPLALGLGRFGSWEGLAALVGTAWLPLSHRRASRASVRAARRSMRFFGSAATPLPAAATLGDAAPVHLRGVCAAMPGSPVGADLWRCRTIDGPGGRSVVEEAEDFVVADPAGARAVVLVEGGRLVNATTLRPGDLASIFGFLDATSDRAGLVREPHGRTGAVLALRSGADHPLLVSVIERYA